MTLRILNLLILVFTINLTSCKSQPAKIVLPKNLDEAVLYFQQTWTKLQLDSFKMKDERAAIADIHFGAGMWLRNNWVRGDRDTAFANYFHSLGIYAPDDISSIVFTSLHRTLNKKAIDLDKQIEPYKKYWKEISDCDTKKKVAAVSIYNKFKTGDNISIFMPVDVSDNHRNAVLYDCPTIEWTFDQKKDLLIKGKIVNKYFINDTANVFFSVKIESLSNAKTEILMTPVKVGDKKDFSLGGLRVE
jgi:hypothetical protein